MSKEKLTALMLLVALFAGLTSTIAKGSIDIVPPILFASLRFFIAAAIVFIFFRKQIIDKFKKENLKPIFFIALLMSCGFIFFNWSLTLTTATNATFFYSLCTLMIPFFAKWINKVDFRIGLLIGLGITITGMYLLITDGGSFVLSVGDCFALISAVFFALQVVFTGRYASQIDSSVLSGVQFLFVAVITLLVSFITGESLPFADCGLKEWGSIAFSGILGTGALYITQTFAQVKLKESTIGMIHSFIPLFTAVSAWVLLGERLTYIGIAGAILMVAGVILAGRLNTPKL